MSMVDLNGKAKDYHIHDILQKIALKKMGNSSFFVVLRGKESNTFERKLATWRLLMVSRSSNVHTYKPGGNYHFFKVHSILYFYNDEILLDILIKDFML